MSESASAALTNAGPVIHPPLVLLNMGAIDRGRFDVHADGTTASVRRLIDAVDRFQPERGVPFEGYASLRIRGAVLDEVRRVDELGRADRRRQREAAAAREQAKRMS